MAEYIEREALLHDIEQSVVYTVRGKITSAEMRGAHKIIERIKCAPAVEPIYIHEPTKSEFKRMAVQMDYVPVVHGRWDDSGRYTFPSGNTAVRCTNCGCALTESEYRLNNWNDGPVCGARMDGGED